MHIKIPKNVKVILDTLNKYGFEAYIVGGCVRDSILGLKPHDWDICTSALPEQVMSVFTNRPIIETGIKHGTVTVVFEKESYEITTYRIDGAYDDNRHPNNVQFTTDLGLDLSRRDFTINAMAYNPNKGLIDIFGGKKDLDNYVLKCVGNASERFNEDALRIMRAMRFASTYDLKIHADTLNAMMEHKELLKDISYERISSEIKKMCSASSTNSLVHILDQTWECLEIVCNELSDTDKCMTLKRMSCIYDRLFARLAVLFDFDKDKQIQIMRRMKFSNEEIKNVSEIREYGRYIIDELNNIDSCNISYFCKKMLNRISWINCSQAAEYAISCLYCIGDERYHLVQIIDKALYDIYNSNECYQLSTLSITGNDVASYGFKGKEIGVVLNYLLDMVMKGTLENDRDVLLNRISELKGDNNV